jgi:hypothetical protein
MLLAHQGIASAPGIGSVCIMGKRYSVQHRLLTQANKLNAGDFYAFQGSSLQKHAPAVGQCVDNVPLSTVTHAARYVRGSKRMLERAGMVSSDTMTH